MNKAYELIKSSILNLTDLDDGDIAEDMKLSDVELDSLDYVSIQLSIKKELGVEFGYDELTSSGATSIGDFARYIDEKMSA